MSEEITYQFNAKIDAEDLSVLFVGTGWADGRTPEKIQILLQNSPLHVSAWCDGKMVGFLRAMTDEVYRAVLDDLVVDQNFRGHEIGKTMMSKMMERLRNVEEISLDCEEGLVSFYKKFGFLPDQFRCLRVWRRR